MKYMGLIAVILLPIQVLAVSEPSKDLAKASTDASTSTNAASGLPLCEQGKASSNPQIVGKMFSEVLKYKTSPFNVPARQVQGPNHQVTMVARGNGLYFRMGRYIGPMFMEITATGSFCVTADNRIRATVIPDPSVFKTPGADQFVQRRYTMTMGKIDEGAMRITSADPNIGGVYRRASAAQ